MEQQIDIDGLTCHYWELNPTKSKTILLIHGFRGTHHGLLKIAEQLDDYRIVIPDLPGFGASEPLPPNHTVASYTQWLHRFRGLVDSSNSSIIVGHSFGTIVASHYTANYPAEVAKLVLINPIGSPALESEQRALTQLAVLYYWLGSKLPDAAARAWIGMRPATKAMSVIMRTSKDPAMRRYIDEQHYEHFSTFASPSQLAEAFNVSVQHDVSQVAGNLQLPVLLIAGEKDPITSLSKQQHLHSRINGAKLVVIKGVGHLTHYEAPDQVAKAIHTFVK